MYVNVSLHDVTPGYEEEIRRLHDLVRRSGFLQGTFLVVPNFHGLVRLRPEDALVGWLRELATEGWEIALHGLCHYETPQPRSGPLASRVLEYLISRWYTSGEGEFYRLSRQVARARIQKGLSVLEECGLKPAGFVAPAWLMGEEARLALGEFAFKFTTSFNGIYDLNYGTFYHAPAITFSSRSPLRANLSRVVVPALAKCWWGREMVRLVLHPLDARRPAIMEDIKRLCQKMLAFRSQVTIREYLGEKAGGENHRCLEGME